MLKNCPECDLQVSDKAATCPHCGYPLKEKSRPVRAPKRMRLPNGFGQISEIKNKPLRNRFRAMVTVGKKENGRPIVRPLKPQSYFATYNEAYQALIEYHRNPYDLSPGITLKELYDKWYVVREPEISPNTIKNINVTWTKHLKPLHDREVKQLRIRDVRELIESPEMPLQTRKRVKTLLSQVLSYAVDHELLDRNVANEYHLPTNTSKKIEAAKKHHINFTDEEMALLWKNQKEHYISILLIQCYSGWRPQELALLTVEDTNITEWTFKGGVKTEAGKNRTVPIHSCIRHLVKRHYDAAVAAGHKYLFMNLAPRKDDRTLIYDDYRHAFDRIKHRLNLNKEHKPHDGRVHFVTLCKNAGVDEYAIKYMVGHEISDITEKVYTRRDVKWLAEEIEKIKGPVGMGL